MRIAVIGAGISGLVAAYLLQRKHDLRVYEAGDHVGGHTYTVDVTEGERTIPVDMGFIVYNERTYPNFCRLMDELGVATQESDMSFGVRNERTGLEYCGSSSLNELFAQRRNLVNPNFYRMLAGILRFHRKATELGDPDDSLTLGDFLRREKLSGPVVEHYLIPMISAIWSTDPSRMREFPLSTLLRFLRNHGMLQIRDRPQWRVVRGGSRSYVEKLTAPFADRIRLGSRVSLVKRRPHCVEVKLENGPLEEFDAVVFAVHSDQALAVLGDATEAEREVLEAIPYSKNDVVLHTDPGIMPRRRLAWASWNYHQEVGGQGAGSSREPSGSLVTYWMNRLQNLDTERDYLVTLNRTQDIDPAKILHRLEMSHPLFTRDGETAKGRWGEISRDRTFYCGAYWGYGFHEDGVKSGLRVATALGESW